MCVCVPKDKDRGTFYSWEKSLQHGMCALEANTKTWLDEGSTWGGGVLPSPSSPKWPHFPGGMLLFSLNFKSEESEESEGSLCLWRESLDS